MPDASVLIAGRDRRTAGVVSWLLREQGHTVHVLEPGDVVADVGGVATARDIPAVLLLDDEPFKVADMIERVRDDDRLRDLRVIVATSPEDESGATARGADDWIRKPYRAREIVARVDAQLRMHNEIVSARTSAADAVGQLARAKETATNAQHLVGILHDVTGELSAAEIYRLLTRRVARALSLTHCTVILAKPGESTGVVVAAFEDPALSDLEIRLDDYPEIAVALDAERSVLVADVSTHALFESLRGRWRAERKEYPIRSVITLPFAVDRWQSGALYIRTDRHERQLTQEDVAFAELVLRAAVTAIRRAQTLETTRADNRRLEELATTDPLTRVLNRRALLDRLTIEVDRARRFDSTLTLLLIDVDYFKLVNDSAGHLAGDDVLRQLASLLADAVRRVDIVARYGGEEFVLILPETSQEGGRVFAERLRERVASTPFHIGAERPLHLTVSVGVATFPSARVETTEALFARADEALYRAKSGGRNLVRH